MNPLVGLVPLLLATPSPATLPPPVPYLWRNVTVGAGGFAPNILFSPVKRDLAYLRTDMGGAYRWNAATKSWIPLQDGDAESSYMGIESLAPDPLNSDVVYIAAGMYAGVPASIQRSEDRGRTWRITPVPFRMGGNEDGRGMGERLAVDPNRTSTLLFGSRHDGLQRSTDSGKSWAKVTSFPVAGLGQPPHGRTHAGISFVLFDSASGRKGVGSRTIYVAVADAGPNHLYRSTDGGQTWAAVSGQPSANLLPVKGALDREGRLYVDYSSGLGPNDIATGAVWRLDTRGGRWTDITPDRSPGTEGGYMGLSLDARRPGRLVVSSVDRWRPGDTVWLSEDAGLTWRDLKQGSVRDVSASPFLKLAGKEADFGHWTAGVAIDPFDGQHIAYTTGATVYGTRDLEHWKPWVRGIEQTAVLNLISPTGGAPLISGFADIAGFVHDDLDVSPPHLHLTPYLPNTRSLDYAGAQPMVVVRSGSGHQPQAADAASLAWSGDGGHSWSPLRAPALSIGGAPARRFDLDGRAPIAVSADGATFVVSTPVPLLTRDHGASWRAVSGLPVGSRVIADKTDAARFYAVDLSGAHLFASSDGGVTFARVAAAGLSDALATAAASPGPDPATLLMPVPGGAGQLWFRAGGALYHSVNGGASFERRTPAGVSLDLVGLGAPLHAGEGPAIYATGASGGVRGVWRSADAGVHWARINDDAHQWGLRFRAITGDPRRPGRVYIATDGRGIFYGDAQ